MCMRKYGFANTWISRKWIQFGVTIRMGRCRDMRGNSCSKNCLLKLGKRGQCRTGDGDRIGLHWTWLVTAQVNAGEKTAWYGQGSYRSATHFVLCLVQFVGECLNPRKCCSTCLYKCECETIAFSEKCTGYFSAAWGRDAAFDCLDGVDLWVVVEELFVCICVWRINP